MNDVDFLSDFKIGWRDCLLPGNWENARRWMTAGKKVRRNHWSKNFYIYSNRQGIISQSDGKPFPLKLSTLQGNDWEIFNKEQSDASIVIDKSKIRERLEQALDSQFPKHFCSERGQALVLFAMFDMELSKLIERIKILEKERKNFKSAWLDAQQELTIEKSRNKNRNDNLW